jgi:AcrR family transcriptional regulator
MAKKSHTKAAAKKKTYHHGNLVEALLAATIELIEEQGVDKLSLREVSKRAGVSPGAPFRHFPSKRALLTAVAEQAMEQLSGAVANAQSKVAAADPAAAFEAIGTGYLEWATANPTHFQIISSRTLIDLDASSILIQNAAIRTTMIQLLSQAQEQGLLAPDLDLNHLVLTTRAFAYGLARMFVDGHFPVWHPSEPPPIAMQKALRLFVSQVFLPSSK